MLSVIITLLLVGLLLWGIIKKMNAAFLLIVLSDYYLCGFGNHSGHKCIGGKFNRQLIY